MYGFHLKKNWKRVGRRQPTGRLTRNICGRFRRFRICAALVASASIRGPWRPTSSRRCTTTSSGDQGSSGEPLESTRGLTGFVSERASRDAPCGRHRRCCARAVGGGAFGACRRLGAPQWSARSTVCSAIISRRSGNPAGNSDALRLGGALPLVRGESAKLVPYPRQQVVVMVHGLCVTESIWNRQSHDHGRSLAQDMQADAVYLRYNSGRHISTNGTGCRPFSSG